MSSSRAFMLGFASKRRGPCALCGEVVALHWDDKPIRSHRRGKRHQAALAAARRKGAGK